jgi:hypothetical protein
MLRCLLLPRDVSDDAQLRKRDRRTFDAAAPDVCVNHFGHAVQVTLIDDVATRSSDYEDCLTMSQVQSTTR